MWLPLSRGMCLASGIGAEPGRTPGPQEPHSGVEPDAPGCSNSFDYVAGTVMKLIERDDFYSVNSFPKKLKRVELALVLLQGV